MLQIHRSAPLALMQLLTDLSPLQHGDLTFYYNSQFLKYRHLILKPVNKARNVSLVIYFTLILATLMWLTANC